MLLTRFIAICPTLAIAVFFSIDNLTGMNDLLNALMSLMLPFALLPTLIMSSSERVMRDFKNGLFMVITGSLLSVGLIGVNLTFVYTYVHDNLPATWWVYLLETLFFTYYIAFVLYLVSACLIAINN